MATRNLKIFFSVLNIVFLDVLAYPVIAKAEVSPTQAWVERYDNGGGRR